MYKLKYILFILLFSCGEITVINTTFDEKEIDPIMNPDEGIIMDINNTNKDWLNSIFNTTKETLK